MSKAPEFPLEVKRDSSTVTIYEREFTKPDKEGKPRRYVEYRLAWYEDGSRKLETSADFLALRSRADEVLDDLKEGRRTDQGAIKASERNDFLNAMKILAPTGQPLHVAVSHYAKAVEILGGDMVIAAAQEYSDRHLNRIKPKLIPEAVEELIAEKERKMLAGKLSKVHVNREAARLREFAKAIVINTVSVKAHEIDRFLDSLRKKDGLDVGPRTRDNWADSIVGLFEWAKLKRYVPQDFDETDRITRLDSDEDGPIEIYTPKEMELLLSSADKELLPVLAIAAFSGLRTSEILRLDWADVRFNGGDGHIVVQRGKVKKRTKSRRIAPMPKNLRAWIKPLAKDAGPVWGWSEPQLHVAIGEAADKAKIERKHNAARHSFISYRLAIVKNETQVAIEAGNSAQMIFSNYRELVTEQEARAWFAISPRKAKPKK